MTAASVNDLRKILDAVKDGAPRGDCSAEELKALAASARAAAARIEEDEIRARRAKEHAEEAKAAKTSAGPAASPGGERKAADSDSDSDGEPTEVDEALVAELKGVATAHFKAKEYGEACKAWGKAAKHLKSARKPDAKLLSNLAAAQLAMDKYVAAAHNAAESVDADCTWWKGHWYRGQALHKMARNKPPSLAMSERMEQAIESFKACSKAPSLPENKKAEVERELKAAKDYLLHQTNMCKQQ